LAEFKETDWMVFYKKAYVEGDTAYLILDMPRSSIFAPTAESACTTTLGYINGNSPSNADLRSIQVNNLENQPLAWTGIDGSCSVMSAP
jgi:hypothetical protein